MAEKAAEKKAPAKKTAEKKETAVKKPAAKKATAAKKAAEKPAPEAVKPVEQAAPAAEKKAPAAKKAAEKKVTEKKATVKKADAKKPAAKKAAKKTGTAMKTILQVGGEAYDISELAEKALKSYKSVHKRKTVTEFVAYVKPEENAAYFTVNGEGVDELTRALEKTE
ncbi:MAG: hypothetical protein J5753_08345 [Oscillospiraceae bacterium]|nr:hypothetical protein [Oscillospiraceae bacterium]